VIIGVLVVAIAVPAVIGLLLWERIDRVSVRLPGSTPGGTTYLLVGSDSRAGLTSAADRASFGDTTQAPGQHADLVLLLRVPDGGGTPRVMAVPRDLLVFATPFGLGRVGPTLNHGPQGLVDSVCRTLGIGVDHLMIVSFLSFAHLVDAVGGVDVTLPVPERDSVLNFRYGPGTFHFDGRTALTYVRVRHVEEYRNGAWQPDPEAALGRGTRAREVLAQIARDAPSIADPLGYTRFAWTASGAVRVDDSSGISDLRNLYDALHDLSRAQDVQLPVMFRDGNVPLATLQPTAEAVVESFQGLARRGPCAHPQMPFSDGSVGHP